MTQSTTIPTLPGLDCGVCGSRTCAEFEARLKQDPSLIKRCIHLNADTLSASSPCQPAMASAGCSSCAGCSSASGTDAAITYIDSLGREFDFYLEHFPEDSGPREIILPHNPMLTRELDIQVGDILIGRPLGMSCGCPITHCGEAVTVDHRTGVMTWCVTGPLNTRQNGYKDMGYYSAMGYEGMIHKTQSDIKIGNRYWFQPRMCMLQWRHSGLVNYINKSGDGLQVRLEGLYIG